MRKNKTKYIPILGAIYNQWTVISTEIKKNSPNRNIYWKVKCICGKEAWRSAENLINNKTNSCKACARSPFTEDMFIYTYANRIKERAKIKKLEYKLTDIFLLNLLKEQNYLCAISKLPIELSRKWNKRKQTASLDRIDNNKGYIETNVQWVHKDINFMKYNYSEEYFVKLCEKVYKNYNNSKCG
jgi:hypothetical protein